MKRQEAQSAPLPLAWLGLAPAHVARHFGYGSMLRLDILSATSERGVK